MNTSDLISIKIHSKKRTTNYTAIEMIITLLECSGCRINEILSIGPENFIEPNIIIINSSKKSNKRVITIPQGADRIIPILREGFKPFEFINYKYVYRKFIELGIGRRFKENKNISVTHYFRHEIIEKLEKKGFDKQELANFTGHKSKKNVLHYTKGITINSETIKSKLKEEKEN